MNTPSWTRAALLPLALLLPGASVAAAKPAPRPIAGTLSKPGYTVIALAANGAARSVRVPRGHFRLRLPARRVTLHLRAADGTYAGPIVLGRAQKGRRAVLGVMAGAKLGRVQLKGARGYAKPKHRLASKWIDAKRTALARRGVPIGAGNFGLVRSKRARGGLRGDTDLDGISDTLDVDDDGDLILDDYDRSTKRNTGSPRRPNAKASMTSGTFPDGSHLSLNTNLSFAGNEIVNANGGSTDAQIAAAQHSYGSLNAMWMGIDPESAELDCGTLVYCSPGGTGRFQASTGPGGFDRTLAKPFPECCDADGDGLGSMTRTTGPPNLPEPFGPDGGGMSLFHGATQDQLRTGDVLIVKGTANGAPLESTASVGFVFSTMPALASYSDGQGNSASFTYPLADECKGIPCAQPVRIGPDGNAVITLTVWRPQRQRLADEPGDGAWMDVGNLTYAVEAGGVIGQGTCPESSYSGLSSELATDPAFAQHSGPPTLGQYRFFDLAGDRPSSPANSFSFTLNLTDCFASKGVSIPPGSAQGIFLWAFSETTGGGIAMANFPAQFVLQP
jgi:hypothetical protein